MNYLNAEIVNKFYNPQSNSKSHKKLNKKIVIFKYSLWIWTWSKANLLNSNRYNNYPKWLKSQTNKQLSTSSNRSITIMTMILLSLELMVSNKQATTPMSFKLKKQSKLHNIPYHYCKITQKIKPLHNKYHPIKLTPLP